MRLKQFIAKDVRGFMNYDIHFRDSVTFLIGINGSGKTTVLKLLSGLLTPSYIDLCQIHYSSIKLICENISDNSQIILSSEKKEKQIILKYFNEKSKETEECCFEYIEDAIIRRRFEPEFVNQEIVKRTLLDFDQSSVVSKIKEMKTPLFLGLNRRIFSYNGRMTQERDYYYERHRRYHIDNVFESVDEALCDIQDLFYNNIRQNAKRQSALSDSFRKKVFAESFRVEEGIVIPDIKYKEELENLKQRRSALNIAFEKLGMTDLSSQFSEFFDSVQKTLETLSITSSIDTNTIEPNPEYVKALLRWMKDSSQVEKIDKIIQYANNYSNNISKLKEPINRFLDSSNLFFEESNKKVTVNEQGDIRIIIKGAKKFNTLYELSSGEKQILVMLAHLSFHRLNQNSTIFVIDEPELSLHISWQEKFVDAILKASPETQFIMATHAPAILAKPERKEWCEDLSNNL